MEPAKEHTNPRNNYMYDVECGPKGYCVYRTAQKVDSKSKGPIAWVNVKNNVATTWQFVYPKVLELKNPEGYKCFFCGGKAEDELLNLKKILMEPVTKQAPYHANLTVGVPQNYDVVDFIKEKVCDFFSITMQELCAKSNERYIVWPRQIAMTLAKSHTKLTLAAIGDKIGGKDHSTVLHAIKTVNTITSVSKKDAQTFNLLNTSIINSSNTILQTVVQHTSAAFDVGAVMLINPVRITTKSYPARCAAIWVMQSVNKTSTVKLAEYFNTDISSIKQALEDRVRYCNRDKTYFDNVMAVRKSIKNVFPVNVETVIN